MLDDVGGGIATVVGVAEGAIAAAASFGRLCVRLVGHRRRGGEAGVERVDVVDAAEERKERHGGRAGVKTPKGRKREEDGTEATESDHGVSVVGNGRIQRAVERGGGRKGGLEGRA